MVKIPAKLRRPKAARAIAIALHRWVGLAISAFLIVAGLTGTVLAFYTDLDAALNPELFRVAPPAPGARMLDPIELRERVRAQLPKGTTIDGVVLEREPGRSVNYWIDERETFVDPYTGAILGRREFGELREGKKGLLTFIYRLHYSLALDDVGLWLFGAAALLWTGDSFVGAYLTFPSGQRRANTPRRAWLRRWAPSWLLKTNTLFTTLFTFHRASGLWLWALLIVFGWSAVALNLHDQVYEPVMERVLGPHAGELPKLPAPRPAPKLDTRAALARGRALIAAEAERRGFRVLDERWLGYEPEHGAYNYAVESTLDVGPRIADTNVAFDGDDGRVLAFHAPTGDNARDTFDSWLIALHFGSVREGGVAYRAFVSLFGTLVAGLSASGVWIWWRKRNKRGRA
jgi:uncharacterized iron-regulated membrane protein